MVALSSVMVYLSTSHRTEKRELHALHQLINWFIAGIVLILLLLLDLVPFAFYKAGADLPPPLFSLKIHNFLPVNFCFFFLYLWYGWEHFNFIDISSLNRIKMTFHCLKYLCYLHLYFIVLSFPLFIFE